MEAKPDFVPDNRRWAWLRCFKCSKLVGVVFGGTGLGAASDNGGGVMSLDGKLVATGRPVVQCSCGHVEKIRTSAPYIHRYAKRKDVDSAHVGT